MKKTTAITLTAVALACLGLQQQAVAQSSVTLYGIADAGIGKAKTDGDRRVNMLSGSTMNNSDSIIGVEGTEDLGNGYQVGFNFESPLSLNDGSAGYATFWGREANVWIEGGWGRLTLGRHLNPSYNAEWVWELTGGANYSVAELTYNYAGKGDVWTDSQFMYTSPEFGGFQAELAYVFKDDAGGGATWDIGLVYDDGPIAAGLAINKAKGEKTNYSLGGKYRVNEAFDVAASYARTGDDNGSVNPDRDVPERRRFTLGASYHTGPFTVTLDLARDMKNHWYGDNKKYTNGVLEGRYALSKRTFIYGAYLRFDGDNNYSLGLQHSF